MAQVNLTSGSSPGTPASGVGTMYANSSDKLPHWVNDSGVDTPIGLNITTSMLIGDLTIPTNYIMAALGYLDIGNYVLTISANSQVGVL